MNIWSRRNLAKFAILLVFLAMPLVISAQDTPPVVKARSVFHLRMELSKEPVKLTRYLTLEPRFQSIDEVAKLGKLFGLDARVEIRDKQFILKDGLRVLELFRESGTGYIRYSDNAELAREHRGKGLPEPDVAIARASELLASSDLLPDHAVLLGSRYSEFEHTDNSGKVIASDVSNITVIFGFELDGIAVLGPGAKAGIVFGDDGKVIGASLIWRPVKAEGEIDLISPLEAFERFKRSWPPEQVENAAIQTDVFLDNVEMAFYAAPGMYPQEFLDPVYAFRGSAEIVDTMRQGEIHEKEQFQILIPAARDEGHPITTTGPYRPLR